MSPKKSSKNAAIKLAVKDFALPIPRRGSIEAHSGYGPMPQFGVEIHGVVAEKRRGIFKNYKSEVPCSQVFKKDGYVFQVSGRIDGLVESDSILIEEFKTSFNAQKLVEKLKGEDDHPYILQLKTYAYMFHKISGDKLRCQLVVISMKDLKEHVLKVDFDAGEYELWLDQRLGELVREAREIEKRRKKRVKLAGLMGFPFEMSRPGQSELIQTIEDHITDGTQMMIQAPTGLGKTVGVMFPVVKEALSRGRQTIYVTPKNSQHLIAEDAVKRFQDTGVSMNSLTITAKRKICQKPEPICDPSYCEYAQNYYGKVYEHQLLEKLSRRSKLNASEFVRCAKKYEICPFELSLDVVSKVDVVICDYNYVFAPISALQRLEAGFSVREENPNLIIDEAHNLYVRAMEYYSPALSCAVLQELMLRMEILDPELKEGGLNIADLCIETVRSSAPSDTTSSRCSVKSRAVKITLDRQKYRDVETEVNSFLLRYMQETKEIKERDPVCELANYWSQFCSVLDFEGDEFFVTYQSHPTGAIVKITCCDPSSFLAPRYEDFANVVAFSATLKPFSFYARLTGFDEDFLETAEFGSPFPKDHRKIILIPQVSTKYRDRVQNYGKIGEAITRIVDIKRGNYFAFFPSFEFLNETEPFIKPKTQKIVRQMPGMSSADVNGLLEALEQGQEEILVMAVQGGVLAEGIDYPGRMLIGAMIIGPPLPKYDQEREYLREYYEKHYGQGFDYAYTYPAMAKAVQAAGRVIRSETDRGVIVMMDRRFVEDAYVKALPSDWYDESIQELVSRRILSDLEEFWNKSYSNGSHHI